MRQWVLSLPFGLRYRLAYDARLASQVLRIFVHRVFASFECAVGLEPDNPTAHLNLAIIGMRHPRVRLNVAEHLRTYLRLVPDAPQRAQMEETIRELEIIN